MDTQELARLGGKSAEIPKQYAEIPKQKHPIKNTSPAAVEYHILLDSHVFGLYYKNLPLSMHRGLACFLEEICPFVSAVVKG